MFEYKKKSELKKMSLEEVEQYFLELRKYEYENNIALKNIKLRKLIHPILRKIIQLDRINSRDKLKVISDKSTKPKGPVVFACTHIGGKDIERTFEGIKKHAYLFLGDPKEIYTDSTGVILNLNGCIYCDTSNKEDRKIAYHKSVELLKKKGNLLIYPEGAWDVFENLPVMKLYSGAVRMAKEADAEIIPVAIEQYDNHFIMNIGKNINKEFINNNTVEDINQKLRYDLATLKFELWETNHSIKREDIPEEVFENFRQSIVDRCDYDFTLQDVYDTMYKDPNEASPEEVFAPVKKLEINRKTAFLFNRNFGK